MANKKVLDILYQSDNNYAVVTGVSIVSLLENNKDLDTINVNLIDGGITKQNLKNIATIVESYKRKFTVIDGKNIEKQLVKYKCRPYKGSYVTYYKLLAFAKLKTESGRILMLDGDILVMRSLKELCDFELGEHIMAEIVDPYMPAYLTKTIGIPKNNPYYNAGVMYINQKVWNEQNCEKRIVKHWESVKSDYLFADQDITNVLFGASIKELELKYNFYSKNYQLHPYERVLMNVKKEMLRDVTENGAVCVHCIDESWRSRPWFKGNTHSMNGQWNHYLNMTPWRGWEKLNTKLNMYHKIDRLLYSILPKIIYAYVLKFVSAMFARLSISKRMLDSKKMNVTT